MGNTVQTKWESRSTVRSRPRIIIDSEQSGYFFPVSHQPLSIHPKVMALGEQAREFLLIQSLYKYSNDIATIETRVVNQTILTVTAGSLSIEFLNNQKLDLYTIMVDEAYHAYVAFDAMQQIEQHTDVKALPLPQTIEIEKAIQWAHEHLPEDRHGVFDLLAVCLAENTLTKEIVSMVDKDETHPFFQKMIKDHLADESRHSGIFFKLMSYIWEKLDINFKKTFAEILPEFLERYLSLSVQTEFDKQILQALGLSAIEADEVICDTYQGFKLTPQHPMLKNIILQLQKSGLMDDVLTPIFDQKGWL